MHSREPRAVANRRVLGVAAIVGFALGVVGFVLRLVDAGPRCAATALIAVGALSAVAYVWALRREGAFGARRGLGWLVLIGVALAAVTYLADLAGCIFGAS